MNVLAISGSLRSDSLNTKVLLAARELADGEVDLELYDGLKQIPPYDQEDDVEPAPAAVAELRSAIAGADAILFSTPEYNSSIPGQLKNALDWASRPLATNPLRNKPVAVVGASTGAFGAVWAQAELRKVLSATGARVTPSELAVGHAAQKFDEDGRLNDEAIAEQLRSVVDDLVAATRERAATLAPQAA
jgi:chromate reductase, NAD(P)H dehydrogenase (quinone)